ncbi:Conserved_hypothetical protein [Hexamita inflata]|uniref:Kinesin motor domain-containing protein n=1 Tax=Hexamita inflata TaxID=28002 RepID=A0AA86RFM8_9EUKA|nr:Conserved hypothetical protein [Hexamita inflata]
MSISSTCYVINETKFPTGVPEIAQPQLISILAQSLTNLALKGQSSTLTVLGPHQSGKTQLLYGKNMLLEQIMTLLCSKSNQYQLALSVFELQNQTIIDHFAQEDNFQSHYKQPSVLSVRVNSKRDFRTLLQHARSVSQNFDENTSNAISSGSHMFSRILVYNLQTKVLSTVVLCDIIGDVQFLFENTPVMQFLLPSLKISQCFYVGTFHQQTSQREFKEFEKFLHQQQEQVSKQVTIKLELKDLITISCDDVFRDSTPPDVYDSQVQSTTQSFDMSSTQPVVDLGAAHGMNVVQQSPLKQDMSKRSPLDEVTDLYDSVNSKISKPAQDSQVQSNMYESLEVSQKLNQQPSPKPINSSPQANLPDVKQIDFKSQISDLELASQVFEHQPVSSNTVKYRDINISNVQSTISQKKSVQSTPRQISPQQRVQISPYIHPKQNGQAPVSDQIQDATRTLKQTETIRNQLETKLRLVESQAAELVLKCDLHRLNNQKRISLAEKLKSADPEQVIQEEEKQLSRLNDQLITQISDNLSVLQDKASQFICSSTNPLQQSQIKSLMAQAQKAVDVRIAKEREAFNLQKMEREFLFKQEQIKRFEMKVNAKSSEFSQKQAEMKQLKQQLQDIQLMNQQLATQMKEREQQLKQQRRVLDGVQNDLCAFQAARTLLGNQPNTTQLVNHALKTISIVDEQAKQRILSPDEIKLKNAMKNVTELGADQVETKYSFGVAQEKLIELEKQIELKLVQMMK